MLLLTVLVTTGLAAYTPAAQAADTGNAAPHPGKIVSAEPSKDAPNILDGTVYSIAKVGNTIVVGGNFTQAQNYNTSATYTRRGVLAFDATTGKLSQTFAPDALGTVYKVLPASDGHSVYVAGGFTSAAGKSMPGRIFKVDVVTGAVDPAFTAPTISGDIRDVQLVGDRLFIAGKFTHINGISQKALGSINATTGKRDPFVNNVFAGTHNTRPGAVTAVLQISINKQNTRLMAVGNFTTVDGVNRRQIVQLDITGVSPTVTSWYTTLFTSACSSSFETYMTDVEYSPNGSYFAVSTTGAYGGLSGSMAGTSGCDVVARFESGPEATVAATWTAYTGGDTTWTVEVTDDVVYAGGHQRWQNNPGAADKPGQGAVSRDGIAALSSVNGLPFSWNPTRARGVGVQDMLATSEGLYVGSDTELIGQTPGNTYHARIALLPLSGGARLPQLQTNELPANLYRVSSGASTLSRRSFTGTSVGTSSNVPSGPGWGSSTGAFMVNGVLYQAKTDGSFAKMTFDGTTYGSVSAVNTSDALVYQTDWHNDARTLTSLFYANGHIYYTKSGTNALYRRGFEVEDDVVGQQRFSTTTTSVNWSNARGAFVAGGKLYFANSNGNLYSATWNQSANNITSGTVSQLTGAGTGWSSRSLFPFQAVPPPVNEPPLVSASVSCDKLVCSFDSAGTSDPENDPLTYDWDFGDGSAHATTATATHTYAGPGDRAVTLTVSDNKGGTSSVTRTASPTDSADTISFVASSNTNGNRVNHSTVVPSGTQVGDTLLLFFTGNTANPVYAGPDGWTEVLAETGTSSVSRLYSKTATAADLGSTATVTSRKADGTNYWVKSDLTMAVYRGLGSPALNASAITAQTVSDPVHLTPTVVAGDGTSWLVSYWADKSTTTSWTGPVSQTQRSTAPSPGSNAISSLLMDSNGRVNTGVQGGQSATANTSAQGFTMSVLLTGGGSAPSTEPPTANATLVGCTGLTCNFDGSTSFDPEGGALTYDWDWGDGTAHGTTATPSHTFTTGGTKTVTLTVTDPVGAEGVDTVTAAPVAPPTNTAPTARITNASCTDLTCSFTGSTSSDPDGDALTYSWDFGGGQTSTATNPSHTFASAGQKQVSLTVNDGQGHTHTATTTVSPTAPTNGSPTARITDVSCTDLTCSFSGATSSDPENETLTYSWAWGDGTAAGSGATPSHTYASAGAKTVTLTVTDTNGNTGTATTTANPTAPGGDPVSNITFVGAEADTDRTTPVPAGVNVGDTLVAFFFANSQNATYTGPVGWTLVESEDGNDFAGRVWTRTATAADAAPGASVTVTFSGTTPKTDLTVAAYRGTDGATPIAASASELDLAGGTAHDSPTLTAAAGTGWLLSYWGDKTSSAPGWTGPTGQSTRASTTGTGGGRAAAILADSNGAVPAGTAGGLTATSGASAGKVISFSILLKSD